MRRAVVVLFFATLLFNGSVARGADGDLDPTFAGTGSVTVPVSGTEVDAEGMALQSDGRIVVAGRVASSFGATGTLALARYETDGTPDAAFGSGGVVTTALSGEGPLGVVASPDGTLYVLRANGDVLLSHFTATGELDLAFGSGGTVTTDCGGSEAEGVGHGALVLQPDGKLVAEVPRANGTTYDACIVRYAADGSLDPSFGTAGVTIVPDFFPNDLALQPSGAILVAGGKYTVYPQSAFAVARLGGDGAIDAGFGANGIVTTTRAFAYDFAANVVSQPDGRVVATSYDFFLARYRTDGKPDAAFGADGTATPAVAGSADDYGAVGIALQGDGRIVIGALGYVFTGPPLNGIEDFFAVVRLANDGTLDSSYGTNGVSDLQVGGRPSTMRLQPDGKAILNGSVIPSPLGATWQVARTIGFSNPCPATPAAACKAPVAPETTVFKLVSTTPAAKNQLQWKWKGAATTPTDFGDPAGGDEYKLCLYDESGMTPTLVSQSIIAGGGLCKGKPCWKPLGTKGFAYSDGQRIVFGIGSIKLKAGVAGKASVLVKGQGGWLVPPSLPLGLPLRVQLIRAGGACWEAVYSSAHASRNDTGRFQGKSD